MKIHVIAAATCLLLSACAGEPDSFGIETPPFGIGTVHPTADLTLSQPRLITYCVSIDGYLYDHARACVKTDYTLDREVQGVPTWCVMAHVPLPDSEREAVDRYTSAVCSGWRPLAL